MKIGYPCINRTISCTTNSTFRLASYSEKKLIEKVDSNLNCLKKILEYNVKHNLLFFRISSDIVPFASHPICKFDWAGHFKAKFKEIGDYIKQNQIRISMHPDQFVLINAIKKNIVKSSIKELEYHCKMLDLLGLDVSAKVQIHVGGVYGDKIKSIQRFITQYKKLSKVVKKRLVIENDHISYSLQDCININKEIQIPVLFDTFHHECLNNGEMVKDAIKMAAKTWRKKDDCLMIDYSSQKLNAKKGTHTEHINKRHFINFLKAASGRKIDIMLEIKDKEKSALKAQKILYELFV